MLEYYNPNCDNEHTKNNRTRKEDRLDYRVHDFQKSHFNVQSNVWIPLLYNIIYI